MKLNESMKINELNSLHSDPKDDPYPEDRLPTTRRSALFGGLHADRLAVMKFVRESNRKPCLAANAKL